MTETPSQKKYRYEHPMLSFRANSRKEWEYFRQMAKATGKSLSAFLRDQTRKGTINYDEGYGRGVQDGKNEVKDEYNKMQQYQNQVQTMMTTQYSNDQNENSTAMDNFNKVLKDLRRDSQMKNLTHS